MYTGLLGIVPLVGGLEVGQHLESPGEDGDEEQGDKETDPDRERDEGIAVPVGTEPAARDVRQSQAVLINT